LFESARRIGELKRLADCSSVLHRSERLRELIKTYIHVGGREEKSGAEKGSYKCLTLALLVSHITLRMCTF